jgi:hypothetical protein
MAQKDKQLSILQEENAIVDEATAVTDTIEQKYPAKIPHSKYLVRIGGFIAVVFAILLFAGYKHQINTVDSTLDLNGEKSVTFIDGTYTGILKNGLGNEFGIYEFNTGVTYSGELSDGKYSGHGKMVYPGVGTYEGNYFNGVRTGQGTFTWEDGTFYTGQWYDDKISGSGKIEYPSGISLQGEFRENKFSNVEYVVSGDNFDGKISLCNDGMRAEITVNGLIYSGPIDESGTLTGKSSITYPNGDSYSGYVLEGKKTEGMYKFKNGDKFDGTFKDDKMFKGTYTFSTGQTLTGMFENGIPEGTMTYTVDSIDYTTTWKNGKCTNITK